ncbi:MAG: protein-disulfide reductase DsbD domain-containing protein [Phycisphaerales bacterium]
MRYIGPRRSWLGGGVLGGLVLAVGSAAYRQNPLGQGAGHKTAEELVAVRTVADVVSIAPGQTFHLAVIFDIEPQWHMYWKNPGEGAPPPALAIEVPKGFEVGEVRWPRPIVVQSPIGPTYVYENQAALFVPITAPDDLMDGRVTIRTDIHWAVCKAVCLLGRGRWSVEVRTASADSQTDPVPVSAPDPVLARLKRRLPEPLAKAAGGSADFDGTMLTITGPAMGRQALTFFPGATPGVSYGDPDVTVEADRFRVEVAVQINRRNTLGKRVVLSGLVGLGLDDDDPSYDFEVEFSNDDRPQDFSISRPEKK